MDKRRFLTLMGGSKKDPEFYFDTFTRDNGLLGRDWLGSTWTINTNKAINTPVGTELVTNGTFTAWTDGVPDGFTLYANSPPTHEVTQVAPNEGHGGAGTGAANIYAGEYGHGLRTAAFTAAAAKWLRLAFDITKRVAGSLLVNVGADVVYDSEGSKIQTFSGGATFAGLISLTAADMTLDNVSLKHIGLEELSAVVLARQTDTRISCDLVRNANTWQAGLVIMDDPLNPLNGLVLYINIPTGGGLYKLVLDKYLNGVRSNLVNSTISLADLTTVRTLVLQKVAGIYYLRIFNLVAGTYAERLNASVEITDAEILACKYFGIFSPDQNITFSNFSLYPSTNVHNTFWVGDSKLSQFYNNCPYYFTSTISVFEEAPDRYAEPGHLMADVKAAIDAKLLAATEIPELVFFNVGVNDANAVPVTNEATFKSDMQYILDAIHTKWASTKIYIMSGVYRTSKAAECATVSGWIKAVMAVEANTAFCYEWADELVWYAADMATYSSDNVHYSVAGCQEAARLGRIACGIS